MNENKNWSTRHSLLQKLKDKPDESSWEEFVDLYAVYINNVFRHTKLGPDEIEDLTQELLLTLWDQLPRLDIRQVKGSFRAWLKTVIKYKVSSYLSRQEMIRSKLTDYHEGKLSPYIRIIASADIDSLIDSEWREYIMALAEKKTKEEVGNATFKAFEMSISGMSVEEVARALGITESTVYVHRKTVKDSLAKNIRRLRESM